MTWVRQLGNKAQVHLRSQKHCTWPHSGGNTWEFDLGVSGSFASYAFPLPQYLYLVIMFIKTMIIINFTVHLKSHWLEWCNRDFQIHILFFLTPLVESFTVSLELWASCPNTLAIRNLKVYLSTGGACTHHSVNVEVRGHPAGISSLLPACGPQTGRLRGKHLHPLSHLKQSFPPPPVLK